jgi:hypothetical protein
VDDFYGKAGSLFGDTSWHLAEQFPIVAQLFEPSQHSGKLALSLFLLPGIP